MTGKTKGKWYDAARSSDCGISTDDNPNEKIERAYRRGFSQAICCVSNLMGKDGFGHENKTPMDYWPEEAMRIAYEMRITEHPFRHYGHSFIDKCRNYMREDDEQPIT